MSQATGQTQAHTARDNDGTSAAVRGSGTAAAGASAGTRAGVRGAAAYDEAIQQRAAGEFAQALGVRRREAGAPVRTIFVSDESVPAPPLARLLRGGGRGGQVRVKLYLSLLWVCAKKPYDVSRPARAWAALLGLPDVEGTGVRRIQQALRDLDDRQFIRLEERLGLPSRVVMLNEKGDGSEFRPAPDAYNAVRRRGVAEDLRNNQYFRVPTSLWTKGHIARLNGPALAMLLALLSERRGAEQPAVWFSPGRAQARFALSPSTRQAGLKELRQLGLLETHVRSVSERGTYIDFARVRQVHEIIGL